jgi:molecular chaperone GrpE
MSKPQEDTQPQEEEQPAQEEQPEEQPSKQPGKKRQSKRERQLQQQVDDLTQDLQRERSDFANYQRRAEAEKEQIMSHAKSEVITQLLPVLDDLERALGYVPEELQDNAWAQGVGKVYQRAQETMGEVGIIRIDALHQPFDPELHEAVEFEDGEGSQEVVTEAMRTGYMFEDKVLRPAMVKVGKDPGPSHQAAEQAEQATDPPQSNTETQSEEVADES